MKHLISQNFLPKYLSDDDYRAFQFYLLRRPEAGSDVSGSGGVRKKEFAGLMGVSARNRRQSPYRFESVTAKNTEKRFDGYFENVNGTGPDTFLEIQGCRDHNIYWRLLREICAFHEQRKDQRPFAAAVVLFIDTSLDPGDFVIWAVD